MLSLRAIIYQLLDLCVVVYGAPMNDISSQLLAAGGNRTTLKSQIAPGLTSSSNYRGTLDIVWSCVLTLTACIYTALHLNIPPHMSKRWHLWRKIKWAATALLAPEFVLFIALRQFTQARELVKQLNERRFKNEPPRKEQKTSSKSENIKPTPTFDLRYGFYVTMGGFTVEVEKLHNEMSHVTLRPKGVIALAERGFFFDIRPETVSDKSKADIITKALICTQILWMVAQCLARKVAGYPLTLLEIHTMVHVVCALAMYLLWWKKPLDINEPTILDPSNKAGHSEITALMLMTSTENSISGQTDKLAELDVLSIDEQPEKEPSAELAITGSDIEPDVNTSPRMSWRDGHDATAKDVRRWELACQVMSKDKSMHQDFIKGHWSQIRNLFSHALTKHSSTSDSNPLDKGFDPFWLMLPVVLLLPLVYGGIHLAAWGFEFPSRAESLLWRICCLIIMIGGMFLYAFLILDGFYFEPLLSGLLWLIGFSGMIIYGAARIFIVLESFLSFRHVPIGIYAAVPWVQNMPHI